MISLLESTVDRLQDALLAGSHIIVGKLETRGGGMPSGAFAI
jgi:hypothetical protein